MSFGYNRQQNHGRQHQRFDNMRQKPNWQGKSQGNFDFQRMESLMESLTALVGRVSALEKGLPSQGPKVMAPPNAWHRPPSDRAGPSSALPVPSLSSTAPVPTRDAPSNSEPSFARDSSLPPLATAARRDAFFPPPTVPKPTSYTSKNSSKPTSVASNHRSNTDPNLGPLPESSNPDFKKLCKSLFYVCQLRRHIENWQTLPASLDRKLKYMASYIRPSDPSPELVQALSSIFSDTGREVRDTVLAHLVERLDLNLTALRSCNPLDKEKAVEVVIRQISLRLGEKGRRFSVRTMVESEAKVTGADRQVPQVVEGTVKVTGGRDKVIPEVDTGTFLKPTNPAKKARITTSPPLTTSNSFSVLSDCMDVTVEPDSPRPTTSTYTSPKTSSSKSKPTTPFSPDLSNSPSPVRKTRSTPDCRRTLMPSNSTANPNTDSDPTPITTTTTSTTTLTTSNSSTTVVPQVATSPLTAKSPSSSSIRPRFRRHLGNDKPAWKLLLRPDTRTLVLSDSNFRDLLPSDIPTRVQVESYGGANFHNTLKLIHSLPEGRLDNLVICLGINHKEELFKTRTLPAITIFFEACRGKARVVTAVGVSINTNLLTSDVDNLSEINNTLQTITHKYIKPLTSNQISTEHDMIHYTRQTQLDILQKIIQHTNTTTKN